MLQVERVDKFFAGMQALDQATLQVPAGKVVAVIGPNGAGKTTLFNVITGHLRPEAGRVIYRGENVTGSRPHEICHRGISRSFQLINIFDRLTVWENVQVSVLSQQGLILRPLVPSRRLVREETEEILEKVGLADRMHVPSTSLSHGDQKVLEIAIALGNRPELFLLDEPTAGMSPEETRNMIELLKALSGQGGLTILFTEHDIDMVLDIADEIMVLHQGRTLIQGGQDEVCGNEQVQKAYLGEPETC